MYPWTIRTLSKAYRTGQTTIVDIARQFVQAIELQDKERFNAVICLNPNWQQQAEALQNSLPNATSPLHGIPILIKDNIDTIDMGNSAGSLALADVPVEADAPLIEQLKAAGALILGKTNLSEWANFRSTESLSGWSSVGGQTQNAIQAGFSPSGSSSGSAVAVAAGFCVAAIGTETDGSIVSPAAHNGIVGFKPTLGRVSRTGIVPIAHSQDTAGPMTRTIEDAALLMNALNSRDESDKATRNNQSLETDFTSLMSATALAGVRIGILPRNEAFSDAVLQHFNETKAALSKAGVTLVPLSKLPETDALLSAEITQMTSEFGEDLAHYLAERRPKSSVKNLSDVTLFNQTHAEEVMPFFKQEWLDECLISKGTAAVEYQQARAQIENFTQTLIKEWFEAEQLDAVIGPCNGENWPINTELGDEYTGGNSRWAAVTGAPSVTIPNGFVNGSSMGLLMFAKHWRDAELLAIANGVEQALANHNP